MKTLALVESPAQLLNVLEWTHQTGADRSRMTTVVLAPTSERARLQLRRVMALAVADGHTVHWYDPRQDHASSVRTVRSLVGELWGVDRLVVGDLFSGVIQLVLSVSRASQLVLVDDGTATIELARLWSGGHDLVRWHSAPAGGHRRQIAALARRRISARTGGGITLFTCMPVQLEHVPVVPNDFSWTRSRFGPPLLKTGADLIGTSLVETGVVDAAHYLWGVQTLADRHGVDRYFAHRLEDAAKLAQIEGLGLQVCRPELPLELEARRGTIGATLISFPSSVVHTLPVVLQDTFAELRVCGIANDWYTAKASGRSDRFLGEVAISAQSAHGLLATAC